LGFIEWRIRSQCRRSRSSCHLSQGGCVGEQNIGVIRVGATKKAVFTGCKQHL
jgi:hypothetical protein